MVIHRKNLSIQQHRLEGCAPVLSYPVLRKLLMAGNYCQLSPRTVALTFSVTGGNPAAAQARGFLAQPSEPQRQRSVRRGGRTGGVRASSALRPRVRNVPGCQVGGRALRPGSAAGGAGRPRAGEGRAGGVRRGPGPTGAHLCSPAWRRGDGGPRSPEGNP